MAEIDDNVAARLKLFIAAENLSNSQFADLCGIPRPSLSQLMSGRNKKISDVIVGMIHRAFPNLSVVWLLFGEGPMVTELSKKSEISHDIDIFVDDDADDADFTNLSDVKEPRNAANFVDYQPSMASKNLQRDSVKKNENPSNPRKVVQITVYYDDNTFETFYPGKK